MPFDPFSYAFQDDPYPTYRLLRDDEPVSWNEHHRFWALSRYDDVKHAATDWAHFSSADGITLERRATDVEPMLLELDPIRHTELRALVSRAFTPKRVAELEPEIRRRARTLIDGFIDAGSCDLIQDFSALLPMAVISTMLGVPEADHDRLRGWSDLMLHKEDGDAAISREGMRAGAKLYAYFAALIAERRSNLGSDLVSALITAEEEQRRLSEAEILGFCFLLIIAGNETTTKLIGNAAVLLAQHPDQRARVVAGRGLIPPMVEEVLRYDGSTQMLARTLATDVTMHGVTMREGDRLLLLFGSGNRDERHWVEPDTFSIDRNPAGHLAFGHGIHHCLGAPLARLETRIAFDELLPRIGEWDVDLAGAERVHSGNVRGYARLPISF
jgi:cytochrome P450